MSRTPGTRIGVYEIVAPLGAGGMGEVYRARDTRLGREVALKLVLGGFGDDPERLARFEREARAVAALTHPNIVTLYSLEEADGVRFLVMELVEGRTLDQVIGPAGLPVAKALDLAIALADALATAHARTIVHRDLKPANLMVTREERLKVLDFGLARIESAPSDLGATQAATVQAPLSSVGQVMGTAPYMAPEQVRGEATDARTDLFAFGILLYEMLTGVRPFRGETTADIASAILRDQPAPLRHVRKELPAGLEAIVVRCLQKDRAERWASAQELRQELVRVKQDMAMAATSSAGASGTGGALGATPAREVPSIAILPFVNRSADAEDEYFAEGLADELLNVLGKIRGLRVAARTSAGAFKGKSIPIAEIGATLNVASVLEGSVRKSGNRVRISVQLVKVADGYHLWSETYDRTLDDIFAVQDDIAQAVVKELRTTLLGEAADSNASGDAKAEVARAAKGRGSNPEAHRLCLQARHFVDRNSEVGYSRGIALYREALALEPDNALAWSGLAYALWFQGAFGWASIASASAEAREAVRRALELEPGLSEAHASLGQLQFGVDWDWAAARASYARALELAPGNVAALVGSATIEACAGDANMALVMARAAVELDPLSSPAYLLLGRLHRRFGQLEEALREYRRALELAPDRIVIRLMMAITLAELGRFEEALAAAQAEPAEWARLTGEAIVLHALDRKPEARAVLDRLVHEHAKDSCFQIAAVYSWWGESDQAFEWLDRGIVERDPGCCFAQHENGLRSLHGDPRWSAFLKRMRFID